MITLHDMNQSWEPPIGFTFESVHGEGSYLVVRYARYQPGDRVVRGGTTLVTIYLQDMGREVMRTVEDFMDPPPFYYEEVPAPPKLVAPRFRFWNGFLIVLQGLREMLLCHKK